MDKTQRQFEQVLGQSLFDEFARFVKQLGRDEYARSIIAGVPPSGSAQLQEFAEFIRVTMVYWARFMMQSDLTDHVCQGPLLPRPGSAATTGSSADKPMVQTNIHPHMFRRIPRKCVIFLHEAP